MKKKLVFALLLAALLLAAGCKAKSDSPQADASSTPGGISSAPSVSSAPESAPSSEPPESAPSSEPPESTEVTVNAAPIQIDGVELDMSGFDNTSIVWGPGHQMDENNRSQECTKLQTRYGDAGALFLMPPKEKKMYLTFDEGYENGYTPKILDVLKEKQCPAVFFVTMDYVKKEPELVRRMLDEGHIVGNHSTTHPANGMPSLSNQASAEDIAKLHNYVAEQFNYQMTLFRPPAGLFSERSLQIAKALDYTSVLWSFAYMDYDPAAQPEEQATLDKLTKMAHPGGIPLLHAVSSTNASILGQAIDGWRAQGYELASLA